MNNADLLGRANLVERVHIVVVGGIADAAILRALALQRLELHAALPTKELIFNNISGAWTWSKNWIRKFIYINTCVYLYVCVCVCG